MVISARYILKDEVIAHDAAQEAFVALWHNRANIDVSKSIRAYIKTATINRSLNLLKTRAHHQGEGEEALLYQDSQYATPEEISEQEELAAIIKTSVDRLPERCREVFVLAKYEGLTYKAIAQQLDITPKTVENQISRALKTLRVSLAHYVNMRAILLFFISLWGKINM